MKKYAAMAVGALAALALAGCAGNAQETSAPAQEEPQEPSYVVIGEHVDGDVEILTTNGLGATVTGISYKEVGAADYSANLITDGTTIAADETVQLCLPIKAEAESATTSDTEKSADDSAAKTSDDATTTDATTTEAAQTDTTAPDAAKLYSLSVTIDGGMVYEMPGLDLTAYKEMSLLAADGIAYVSYVTDDGTRGDTQQASRTASQEAQAKAEAEAAAAEAAAAEAASASRSTSSSSASTGSSSGSYSSGYSSSSSASDYTYDDSDYSYSAPSGGYEPETETAPDASAPSQESDSCVDDVIFNN